MTMPINFKPIISLYILTAFSLFFTQAALAEWKPGTPDYRMQKFRLHEVRGPKDFLQQLEDVIDSEFGEKALKAAAAYYGINPANVEIATKIAGLRRQMRGSEASYLEFHYPEGFVPCKIKIRRNSLNGPGKVGLRVWPKHLGAYVRLKRNNFGGGRTWANLDIEILSIYWRDYRNTGNGKAAWQDGTCDYRVWDGMPELATKVIFEESFE